MAERNAASVLPDPVGAATRTCFPARMSGHASRCGAVGVPTRWVNQASIAGWNPESTADSTTNDVQTAPAAE